MKKATEKTGGRIGAICYISSRLPKLSLGGEGRETTIKIVWEKIRTAVKGGAQDTVQHPAKNEGRVGARREPVRGGEARVINVPFMRDEGGGMSTRTV